MAILKKSWETRKHTVKAFLTTAEYNKLNASANMLRMSKSEYIRMKVFGPEWNQKAHTDEC